MKISVVVPCLNHVVGIESTLKSILDGNNDLVEVIVMDGGSTDGTCEIIEKWSSQLAYWTSQPDGGQYQALVNGFKHATGELYCWLNAGDSYYPWTLKCVTNLFERMPSVNMLTSRYASIMDSQSLWVQPKKVTGIGNNSFRRGYHCPGHRNYRFPIQQESTFWRKSVWEKVSKHFPLKSSLAGDFELWCHMLNNEVLWLVDAPLGIFKKEDGQRSKVAYERYTKEALKVFEEYMDSFTGSDLSKRKWIKELVTEESFEVNLISRSNISDANPTWQQSSFKEPLGRE